VRDKNTAKKAKIDTSVGSNTANTMSMKERLNELGLLRGRRKPQQ